jgi:tRNA nucleotidyltransferase (CCA-adding enzyme)
MTLWDNLVQIYLVGGAVRDEILGLKVIDHDHLVVGATPDQLLSQGFTQVGTSFPVFLHPKSGEEYALARTERKVGAGYTGFECQFGPDVTLEEDLLRRDLTINAMAQDAEGQLFDPYGGRQDLKNRVLRHVSDAFTEDPLRVLRVARFAARFAHLDFTIAPETLALMKKITLSGELTSLTAERVWKEMEKALASDSPQVFFQVLREIGALAVLLPELDNLFGIPAPKRWHPEVDTGVHALMVVAQIAQLTEDIPTRFAALCHDFGKAKTPPEKWPSHHGHGTLGLSLIVKVCERFKIPNAHKELALLVSEFHGLVHTAHELRPQTLLKFFNQADAWRKPERFEALLLACWADLRGRLGFESCDYPSRDYLLKQLERANQVPVQAIVAAGFKGAAIRTELDRQRLEILTLGKQTFASH